MVRLARPGCLDQRGLQLLVHACHDGDPDHQQHGAEYGFCDVAKARHPVLPAVEDLTRQLAEEQ